MKKLTVALLSGGIGITPFRSICKFATDKELPSSIVMLYGSNTRKDIIFEDDLAEMNLDGFIFFFAVDIERRSPK